MTEKKFWVVKHGNSLISTWYQFLTKQGEVTLLFHSYEDAKAHAKFESEILEIGITELKNCTLEGK